MTRIPWGKYAGWDLSEIPLSYLCWVIEKNSDSPTLISRECKKEVIRRLGGSSSQENKKKGPEKEKKPTKSWFMGWYRRASVAAHPDLNGGNKDLMKLVNEIKDWVES